jgi:hypothetical protein
MSLLIIGSLILSLLHSVLFFNQGLGISVILFVIPLSLYVIRVLGKLEKIKNVKPILLLIPIILLSATYGIFNSNLFGTLNIFVIGILFAIMSFMLVTEKKDIMTAIKKLFSVIFGPLEYVKEPFTEMKNKMKVPKEEDDSPKTIKRVLKSLFLCSPLIIIIVLLLSSADIIFGNIVESIINKISEVYMIDNIMNFIWRVIIVFVTFTYIAAYIYNLTDEDSLVNSENEKTIIFNKPKVDSYLNLTLITVLNIIYLFFSIIQFSYLFAKHLPSDFDYATYARAGFFQLVAVSVINLVLILISTAKKEETVSAEKYKKYMNVLLCVFNGILLVSSFYRMYLYETEYGYTTLRLLVYFGIVTEAILLLITMWYIFNKKVKIFLHYFVVITLMYVIINYVNLDKVIAERNVDRYFEKDDIDIEYLLVELGTDAVPEIERLRKKTTDRDLKNRIEKYYSGALRYKVIKHDTFPEYNVSIDLAREMLKE